MNSRMVIFSVIAAGLFFYFLGPILTPFLAGAILAYLGNPLVNRLTKWKIPRILSVIIVFLLVFFLLISLTLGLIPLIGSQFVLLMNDIPNAVTWLQNTVVPWVNIHLGTQDLINTDTIKQTIAENWTKAGTIATWFFKTTLHSGVALIQWGAIFLLTPVVTFYLLRDWQSILLGIRKLLPRRIEPTVVKLAKSSDEVLSAFFRGQLLVMLSLGIIYSVGLTILGLKVGIIIGLIAGLLSLVPYLGFIVGITSASIAGYLQFGSFTHVVLIWIVFLIGQSIEGTLLTPNLVGNRIGLHPVAVIFAVLTGGTLFGFFGVLLALPVASVLMVLLRYGFHHYSHSKLYS